MGSLPMKVKIYHYAKLKNPAKKAPYTLNRDGICCLILRRFRKLGMNLVRAYDDEFGNTTLIFNRID